MPIGTYIFGLSASLGVTEFATHIVSRLLLAGFLGGAIGLERELKRRPAGLRTNMFICFGSALFTILSEELAASLGGDHTRIASQIIPGIGFIGAGSILHAKGSVQGLTSAATIFVVAAIGMAAGGGLYLAAIFGTLVILIALQLLGLIETKFDLKQLEITYEAEGDSAETLLAAVNRALGEAETPMQSVQVARVNEHLRVVFSVEAVRSQHDRILRGLRTETAIRRFNTISKREQE